MPLFCFQLNNGQGKNALLDDASPELVSEVRLCFFFGEMPPNSPRPSIDRVINVGREHGRSGGFPPRILPRVVVEKVQSISAKLCIKRKSRTRVRGMNIETGG
jgi:hypothetical protein